MESHQGVWLRPKIPDKEARQINKILYLSVFLTCFLSLNSSSSLPPVIVVRHFISISFLATSPVPSPQSPQFSRRLVKSPGKMVFVPPSWVPEVERGML